ncbi:hypothetical protein [Streptomyces carpinensis]|uniref:Transposase n=1 Tax=Streptomyces carpinensis TaxID=66369 RepID=A0ABV1VV73_9ACTN
MVLQQSLRDLGAAYRNFLDSLSGKRKGPKVEEPRLKSKRDTRQSVRFTANARWKITGDGRLRLPGIGPVRVRWSRELPSALSTVLRSCVEDLFRSMVKFASSSRSRSRASAN